MQLSWNFMNNNYSPYDLLEKQANHQWTYRQLPIIYELNMAKCGSKANLVLNSRKDTPVTVILLCCDNQWGVVGISMYWRTLIVNYEEFNKWRRQKWHFGKVSIWTIKEIVKKDNSEIKKGIKKYYLENKSLYDIFPSIDREISS